jgi:predicted porin
MQKLKISQAVLAALSACAAFSMAPVLVHADDAQDIQTLKDQVRQLQNRIDNMGSRSSSTAPAGSTTPGIGNNAATMSPDMEKRENSPALTYGGITLYGTVDLGVAYMTHGAPLSSTYGPGLPFLVQNFSNRSIVSLEPNGLSQSKVGITGVESLHVLDLNAVFRVETGFQPNSGRLTDGPGALVFDNGKAASLKTTAGDSNRAGQAFNGPVYVGVSSATFGTVTFGRQNGVLADLYVKYDPMQQSQSLSPIGYSGNGGGLGDTEDKLMDNQVKYALNYGPAHLEAMHAFGTDGNIPQTANEVALGADYAGASVDAFWGKVKGAVAASSLTAAQIAGTPAAAGKAAVPGVGANTLAATISDNTAYSIEASYTLNPVKFYAGWERIKYNNPESPVTAGAQTIGGYTLSIVNNAAYTIQRIFTISWIGARYQVMPKFEVAAAAYMYNQKSYAANGCTNLSATTCAGEEYMVSGVADYHFTKRFDTYFGVEWSQVENGLGSGFLFRSEIAPELGLRFNF